jgi:hybrid cluster-associated redox disulfide protein
MMGRFCLLLELLEKPVIERTGEITTDSNIDWVLDEYPATVPVFLRWRMQCVGCPMARFESIAEACTIYQRPLGRFLNELRLAASQTDLRKR